MRGRRSGCLPWSDPPDRDRLISARAGDSEGDGTAARFGGTLEGGAGARTDADPCPSVGRHQQKQKKVDGMASPRSAPIDHGPADPADTCPGSIHRIAIG